MVKRKPFIILVGLLTLLFISGVAGTIYALISTEVTNRFETGIVDIELTEYQKTGNKEELWRDNPTILPNDRISKIPRIHNDGNDCYVRAKVTFIDTKEVGEDNLYGISDKWMKASDGYYYYTEILPHGEDVDIFEGLHIPVNFSQELEGTNFSIDIDVDAIQSQNFTPQFTTASPWGDVEILQCGKEGQYDITTFKQADSKTFTVEYQGDTKKLITNSDDFFANFPYLMPGDTYSDSATIVNDGNHDIKLYFKSEALDESELLDKIGLKITTTIDGKQTVVYEGMLRASELSKDVLLGTIPKNAKGDFAFEIQVPAELNNEYSILKSYVKWIFSTEPIISNTPIKTGDTYNLELYVFLMVCSLLGLFVILLLNNRRERRMYEKVGNEKK